MLVIYIFVFHVHNDESQWHFGQRFGPVAFLNTRCRHNNPLCVPMQICDAVYGLVVRQAQAQYEAVVQSCEAGRPLLEASIRTDMDQIITSKEHVANKIKGEPSVTLAFSSVDDSSPLFIVLVLSLSK